MIRGRKVQRSFGVNKMKGLERLNSNTPPRFWDKMGRTERMRECKNGEEKKRGKKLLEGDRYILHLGLVKKIVDGGSERG